MEKKGGRIKPFIAKMIKKRKSDSRKEKKGWKVIEEWEKRVQVAFKPLFEEGFAKKNDRARRNKEEKVAVTFFFFFLG